MSTNGAKPLQDTSVGRATAGPISWLDQRVGMAGLVKKHIRKVFPDHWSFMLGEIALYSFVILLLSGVFLSFWFDPSMGETVYTGSYSELYGIEMSRAFASTLEISFDIRGGLLMRQIHHWAAMLFIAAMLIHMLRVFFTGAYRKPRELNWLIGVTLFAIALIEGFAGYSLPDDLLSGTGLRFVDGLIRSIPIVGGYLELLVFGGEFPGDILIPRLYILHVLLLPGLILGLITAHLLLLVYHKHTQWPGPGRTNENVVGYPFLPVYMAKAGGFFFMVFGVTALMGALIQINPVWKYGPYNPSEVTAGSQPDWYMGWVEGAVRIMPPLEFDLFGLTWSWNVFIPGALLMGVLFTVLGLWPFVERWITGDETDHHLLQRPRNAPTRTALGVAGMTCYGVFWIAGGNDILAITLHSDIYAITWAARILVFVGPVIAFIVTKRICLGLQRQDRERVLHGYESGVIERSPSGGYSERHVPLTPDQAFELANHTRPQVLEAPDGVDPNGVEAPGGRMARLRARASRFYSADDVERPSRQEIEDSHHGDHAEIEPGDQEFRGISETGIPKSH